MTVAFRSSREAGFTLMELTLVLVLVGILAGTLMSHVNLSFDNPEDDADLRRAERTVRVRVAHVQNEAMRLHADCTVQFGPQAMEASCDGFQVSLPGEAHSVPYGEGIALGKDSLSEFTVDSDGIISADGRKALRLRKNETTLEFKLVTGVRG